MIRSHRTAWLENCMIGEFGEAVRLEEGGRWGPGIEFLRVMFFL